MKSSNTNRRYIAAILKTLSDFPWELVGPEFMELSEDRSFSYKIRAKFRECAEGNEIW